MDPEPLKKKKRSFFEEDDFFVMKPKKTKSSPKKNHPAPGLLSELISNMSTNPPNRTPNSPNPTHTDPSSPFKEKNKDLEDFQKFTSPSESVDLVFHSATDIEAGPMNLTEVLDQAKDLNPHLDEMVKKSEPVHDSGEFPVLSNPENNDQSQRKSRKISAQKPSNDKSSKSSISISLDETDDDNELNDFFNHVSQPTVDESHRRYSIRVVCKGTNLHHQEVISGDQSFGDFLNGLEHKTRLATGMAGYWMNRTLWWVEGRSELKPFFKPSTLRIPPPLDNSISHINCRYLSIEELAKMELLNALLDELLDEQNVVEIESEDTPEAREQPLQESKVQEYFVIGLKGKDNKRFEVEVSAKTQIRSLLNHYFKEQGIEPNQCKNPKLVFDDEELNLESLVGDTELEEDFEVQVYI